MEMGNEDIDGVSNLSFCKSRIGSYRMDNQTMQQNVDLEFQKPQTAIKNSVAVLKRKSRPPTIPNSKVGTTNTSKMEYEEIIKPNKSIHSKALPIEISGSLLTSTPKKKPKLSK